MNKILSFLFLTLLVSLTAQAAEIKTAAEIEAEEEAKREQDMKDAMFTGVKVQQGTAVLVEGEEIAADPSVFQSGKVTQEQLDKLRRHVVSSTGTAGGTVYYSESGSSSSAPFGTYSENDEQNVALASGLTVSSRD